MWTFNNELVAWRPQSGTTRFANDVKEVSMSADLSSQRKKSRGTKELLIEDQLASDDDVDCNDLSKAIEATSTKVSQTSCADIVEAVGNESDGAKPAQTSGLEQRKNEVKAARSTHEIAMHHLVRELLLMHCHEDIVEILDQERVMPLLGAAEVQELSRHLTGTHDYNGAPSTSVSLLERFLICSNDAKLRTRRLVKDNLMPAEKETRTKGSSTRRRKPTLNVLTSNLGQDAGTIAVVTPLDGQVRVDYNRLEHPGSTPRHGHGPVIGEPGSTPMARAKDLGIISFDNVEDDNAVAASCSKQTTDGVECTADDDSSQLSHYALQKRMSKTRKKRVQLGDPGRTPTKEYIFYRETPPSFVTETLEDATEVFETLVNDPEFVQQGVLVEQFIELQSSEVSKYTVGQIVHGLGAQFNISGTISKIYGSRLCGTAGPGTIVIDTH